MPRTAKRTAAKTKTVSYDVAEQLRTPEEMAAYLDAWLTDAPDDVAGIARALGDIARARGMAQVALDAGLSRESLYKSLMLDAGDEQRGVSLVAEGPGSPLSRQPPTEGAVDRRLQQPVRGDSITRRRCAAAGMSDQG